MMSLPAFRAAALSAAAGSEPQDPNPVIGVCVKLSSEDPGAGSIEFDMESVWEVLWADAGVKLTSDLREQFNVLQGPPIVPGSPKPPSRSENQPPSRSENLPVARTLPPPTGKKVAKTFRLWIVPATGLEYDEATRRAALLYGAREGSILREAFSSDTLKGSACARLLSDDEQKRQRAFARVQDWQTQCGNIETMEHLARQQNSPIKQDAAVSPKIDVEKPAEWEGILNKAKTIGRWWRRYEGEPPSGLHGIDATSIQTFLLNQDDAVVQVPKELLVPYVTMRSYVDSGTSHFRPDSHQLYTAFEEAFSERFGICMEVDVKSLVDEAMASLSDDRLFVYCAWSKITCGDGKETKPEKKVTRLLAPSSYLREDTDDIVTRNRVFTAGDHLWNLGSYLTTQYRYVRACVEDVVCKEGVDAGNVLIPVLAKMAIRTDWTHLYNEKSEAPLTGKWRRVDSKHIERLKLEELVDATAQQAIEEVVSERRSDVKVGQEIDVTALEHFTVSRSGLWASNNQPSPKSYVRVEVRGDEQYYRPSGRDVPVRVASVAKPPATFLGDLFARLTLFNEHAVVNSNGLLMRLVGWLMGIVSGLLSATVSEMSPADVTTSITRTSIAACHIAIMNWFNFQKVTCAIAKANVDINRQWPMNEKIPDGRYRQSAASTYMMQYKLCIGYAERWLNKTIGAWASIIPGIGSEIVPTVTTIWKLIDAPWTAQLVPHIKDLMDAHPLCTSDGEDDPTQWLYWYTFEVSRTKAHDTEGDATADDPNGASADPLNTMMMATADQSGGGSSGASSMAPPPSDMSATGASSASIAAPPSGMGTVDAPAPIAESAEPTSDTSQPDDT